MGRESLKKLQDGVLESKGIYPVYVAVMLFASVFTPANNTARDIIQITLASVAFFLYSMHTSDIRKIGRESKTAF